MLGHDVEVSDGIWTCGKDGQSVPVGVGCPTIKIARSRSAGRGSDSRRALDATHALATVFPVGHGAMPRVRGADRSSWSSVTGRTSTSRGGRGAPATARSRGPHARPVGRLRAAWSRRERGGCCAPWSSRPASAPTWRSPLSRGERASRELAGRRRASSRCRRARWRALEPSSGFDDFIVTPYDPAELYARIRALEWRRSEFSTEERLKIGALVDRSRRARGHARRAARGADGEGVRAARLPGGEPRARVLARRAPRARVGGPLRGGRAHGGHPRAPPARQARRRAAARDDARRRLQAPRAPRRRQRARRR